MIPPFTPDAVLFDFDGTLADTEAAWDLALADFIDCAQLSEETRGAYLGGTVDDMVRVMRECGVEGSARELSRRYVDRVIAHQESEHRRMPYATRILAALAFLPIGVASNSPTEILRSAAQRTGLDSFTDVWVACDEVEHGKPAPDLYRTAACRLGVDPGRCVAFEDSPMGAQAATSAGCYVVGVNADLSIDLTCRHRIASLGDEELWAWIEKLREEQTHARE